MPADRKRVFIVDDDDFVRSMVCKLVKTFGYDIEAARDGEEALSLLGAMPALPDVVLTDIVMPKKDGLETLREMRELFPNLKIVAVSGGGRSEQGDYLELARTYGANEILSKPIDPQQLKDVLRQLTEPSAAAQG